MQLLRILIQRVSPARFYGALAGAGGPFLVVIAANVFLTGPGHGIAQLVADLALIVSALFGVLVAIVFFVDVFVVQLIETLSRNANRHKFRFIRRFEFVSLVAIIASYALFIGAFVHKASP
jgi:mannose/fructose/N-acetylgalactosamine-specific phosphotransferase system component IIC